MAKEMTDEPQTPTPNLPETGQGSPEDQGVPMGDRRVEPTEGHWEKVEIPPGHYLKDGQIFWDFNDPYYRECQPKTEAPRAS